MEFQNVTVYNRKILATMNRAAEYMLKGTPRPALRVIRIAAPLMLVLCAIYLLYTEGVSGLGVASLILGGVILFWNLFAHQFRALVASLIAVKHTPRYQIDFDDNGYVITYPTPDGGQDSSEPQDYDTVWDACRTRECFVLMVGRHQGYVLRLDGFTKGSPDDFAAFLEGKLGQPVRRLPI